MELEDRFKYNFNRRRYEAYLSPSLWDYDFVTWLYQTFGKPGPENGWDHYAGWLFFTDEVCYTNFKTLYILRWH